MWNNRYYNPCGNIEITGFSTCSLISHALRPSYSSINRRQNWMVAYLARTLKFHKFKKRETLPQFPSCVTMDRLLSSSVLPLALSNEDSRSTHSQGIY